MQHLTMSHHHSATLLEEHNTDSGRFLFINDVLCKTDDNDGEFVPSDIFGLLADLPSKSPAVTLIDLKKSSENFVASSEHCAPSFTSPTLGNKRIRNCNNNSNNDEGNCHTNSNLTNYELDSSVFNVFGVLSCGVLLDNASGKFVDAASHDTFKPFLLSPHAAHENSKCGSINNKTTINDTCIYEECIKQNSNCKEQKETQKAVHQFCEQNIRAYCNRMFCAIRAENALTYCSSMKPLLVEQGNNLANYECDISNIEKENSIAVEHVAQMPIVLERTNEHKLTRKKQDMRCSRSVVKDEFYEYMIFTKHKSKREHSLTTKKQHQSSPKSLLLPSSLHDSSHMQYDNDVRIVTEFFRRWRKSEKYRINCHHYNNDNCNNYTSSVFLPSFIPYRFQHRGKVIAPSYSLPHAFANNENDKNNNNNYEYGDKNKHVETNNVSNNAELFKTGFVTTAAVVNDCTGNEHSAIMCNASFLSGRSLFARGMYSTPRNDVSLWRHGSYSPLYFWQSFKPYNTDASIDYNKYLQNNEEEKETYNSLESNQSAYDALGSITLTRTTAQEAEELPITSNSYNEEHLEDVDSCYNKLSVLPIQEQKTDISDVIEYMSDFAAPKSKSMYSKAWRIFILYFQHLGIITEQVETSDESHRDHKMQNRAVQYKYSLCSDKLYHVEKEVKYKLHRSVADVSRTIDANITDDDDNDDIFRLTRKITTQADKADAWDVLLQSSWTELLRRIACIEQYMKQKHL